MCNFDHLQICHSWNDSQPLPWVLIIVCNFYHLQISITVQPGAPVEISPDLSPGTPTVSNTRNAASRCLLRSLRVSLKDQYRNLVTDGYNGSVELKIVGPPGISEIPVFVGGSRSLTIPLTNGEAVLQVGVGVCWCWCVCVGGCFVCVGPPGISEIPVFVGGSWSLTIPLTNGEAVLQVCVGVCVGVGVLVWVFCVCWPTWHLGDPRLRWRVPVSHHSTHQWRGSTTGVCGCVLVLVWVCVGVCVLFVLAHLASRRFPSSLEGPGLSPFHSPMERQYYRCVWMCVGVGVGVCWCVCFVCVGPPGISEIPVFVGGSRSLTIPLTNGEAVLQVCVGCGCVLVWVCVGMGVCVLVCVFCVCRPTRHLGDPRLRRRVPLSHHSTHQWRGSTTGVCGCGCVCGCVLVGGCVWVFWWVCVGVGVGVCWYVCFVCVGVWVWVWVGVGVCGCVLAHLASRRSPSS